MKTQRNGDKDLMDHLEEFFELRLEPRLKKASSELERLLKREKNGKAVLEYDPDSPFSYLAAFLRDRKVASVAPSTKYVVDRVLKAMELDKARVVVEFGPAEGVMTRRILPKLPPDGILVAVELNENFAETLKKIKDSRLRVINGDVREIDKILEREGIASADVMISGIPFSFFTPPERQALLGKISSLLNPHGRFIAYQFTTHLIPLLKRYFRRVKTEFEIRNLPPHFVFSCYK
ncbi:MAG TPA: rRNA adenine N-6-methyltransferase family protein [Elusimicrobiota bacterium]|jgi:phospholipid N-methyltransferase|nr:rRNA adenine N-6-methyltransferase family protein [Elusimicrobiota bacterium]